MHSSIPTLDEFCQMFPNKEMCHEYLVEKNVFYETLECTECSQEMKLYRQTQRFICTRRSCSRKGRSVSMRTRSFFFGTSLNELEIMRLALFWLSEVSIKSAIIISGHSPQTVSTFYRHFRQLVSSALREENQVIGGPGVIVEI